MKATKITYSRLISTGNYENSKIEIEMQVEEGEKAVDVLRAAKEFVYNAIEAERISKADEHRIMKQKCENDRELDKARMLANDDLPF